MNEILVECKNLQKYYSITSGIFREKKFVRAVDGVSFQIGKGKTLGLVGESGCGKTTVGKLILGLIQPDEGEVFFLGNPIFKSSKENLRKLRREMQIVFQDPYASLNPRMTVSYTVSRPLGLHNVGDEKDRRRKVLSLLEKVGLSREHLDRYPHEFSGGQRQRIAVARALALNPKLIVLDEPTSALDVSVQSQILNLLLDLQKEFKLTYLFISHNLNVVRHVSDRIAVMYLGKIIEISNAEILFNSQLHPYTQALVSAIPMPDPKRQIRRIILPGEVPSAINPPKGCRFHPRCSHGEKKCMKEEPKLIEADNSHLVACHFWYNLQRK